MNHTEAFKPVIWLFIKQYNKAQEPFIKKKLKEALKDTIKKMTDQKVKMVSEKAFSLCQASGFNPFELLWDKRNVIGRDSKGKSLLCWEHTTPISEFFELLIKCKTKEEAFENIDNYSGVCWITRDEDNLLTKEGYRSKRPGGWKNVYDLCGIKVIKK